MLEDSKVLCLSILSSKREFRSIEPWWGCPALLNHEAQSTHPLTVILKKQTLRKIVLPYGETSASWGKGFLDVIAGDKNDDRFTSLVPRKNCDTVTAESWEFSEVSIASSNCIKQNKQKVGPS